ncbi:MAG: tyrosine-type recombinase/integrase [Geminicoccaceae bacterium]
MTHELEPVSGQSIVVLDDTPVVPKIIAGAGGAAAMRFIEFFTAQIHNPHTRKAYGRAVSDFCHWCDQHDINDLIDIRPVHVAAYVKHLGSRYAAPSTKQKLAAIRMLFDWLVTGHVMRINPAMSVRGPKHVVKKGKTPVLSPEQARELIDSIPTTTMAGLRDRALIGLMIYSFARIGAALTMNVEDVFHQRNRLWLRLQEKGGKQHEMPCHHNLEDYLRDYIQAAGIGEERKAPLFRAIDRRSKQLSDRRLKHFYAWAMVKRRARQAGIPTEICNHTFRATGITAYLTNGGQLEIAANMAAHSSTRTTQLYDRRSDDVSLNEVERIVI